MKISNRFDGDVAISRQKYMKKINARLGRTHSTDILDSIETGEYPKEKQIKHLKKKSK